MKFKFLPRACFSLVRGNLCPFKNDVANLYSNLNFSIFNSRNLHSLSKSFLNGFRLSGDEFHLGFFICIGNVRFYPRSRPTSLRINRIFSEFTDSKNLEEKLTNSSSASSGYFDLLTKGLDVEVKTTKEHGRSVFAMRNFEVGEIIHNALPLVSHPLKSQRNKVCYLCLRRLNSNNGERNTKHVIVVDEKMEQNNIHESMNDEKPIINFKNENERREKWKKYYEKQKEELEELMKFDNTMFCSKDCERKAEDDFYELEKAVDWNEFNEYCNSKGLKFPHLVKRFSAMVFCNAASANALKPFSFGKFPGSFPEEWIEQHNLLKSAMEKIISIQALHYMNSDWYCSIMSRLHLNSFQVQISKNKKNNMEENTFSEQNAFNSMIKIGMEDAEDMMQNKMKIKTKDDAKQKKNLNFFEKNYFEPKGKEFVRPLISKLSEGKMKRSEKEEGIEEDGIVGSAMYLLPSFYNHSCDPNIHIFWKEDVTAQIYAIKKIQKGDELFLTYIDASMGYAERQKHLKQFYGFQCDCDKCLSKF